MNEAGTSLVSSRMPLFLATTYLRRAAATALLLGTLPLAATAQAQESPDQASVRQAIEAHYFKAHATGDGAALKGMFLDDGRMMWVQDGQIRSRTGAEYVAGFTGTPPADEAVRRRAVLMTDVTGDVAIAKVSLDYPGVHFTDYFSLLRVGGEWKIVHKQFHRATTR